MRKYLILASAALVVTACSSDSDKQSNAEPSKKLIDAVNVNPGLWETKITFNSVDAKALPETTKQQMIAAMSSGVTIKTCVTKEKAEKPGAEFFGSPKSSNCTVGELKASAEKMAVKLICKPDTKTVIESSMAGQFTADTYTMDIKQKTSGTPIGDLITTGKIDGKRLGECPA